MYSFILFGKVKCGGQNTNLVQCHLPPTERETVLNIVNKNMLNFHDKCWSQLAAVDEIFL